MSTLFWNVTPANFQFFSWLSSPVTRLYISSTGHVMNSCQGRNGFYCFLLLFFLFLWFYLSKLLSIFQTGKKALDCFFLHGVLLGKTACNKFMHRDQGFHSKTQSSFPFFFIFRFVFGPFYWANNVFDAFGSATSGSRWCLTFSI